MLPVTLVEADALAFACAWFRYWRGWRDHDAHPLTQHSPLSVDAGRAMVRFAFQLGATS